MALKIKDSLNSIERFQPDQVTTKGVHDEIVRILAEEKMPMSKHPALLAHEMIRKIGQYQLPELQSKEKQRLETGVFSSAWKVNFTYAEYNDQHLGLHVFIGAEPGNQDTLFVDLGINKAEADAMLGVIRSRFAKVSSYRDLQALQEAIEQGLIDYYEAATLKPAPGASVTNKAMLESSQTVTDWARGGIDFNAKNMNLDFTKAGKSIEIKFDPAMVTAFQKSNFTGVDGIIIRIVPIQNLLPILGYGA